MAFPERESELSQLYGYESFEMWSRVAGDIQILVHLMRCGHYFTVIARYCAMKGRSLSYWECRTVRFMKTEYQVFLSKLALHEAIGASLPQVPEDLYSRNSNIVETPYDFLTALDQAIYNTRFSSCLTSLRAALRVLLMLLAGVICYFKSMGGCNPVLLMLLAGVICYFKSKGGSRI